MRESVCLRFFFRDIIKILMLGGKRNKRKGQVSEGLI